MCELIRDYQFLRTFTTRRYSEHQLAINSVYDCGNKRLVLLLHGMNRITGEECWVTCLLT